MNLYELVKRGDTDGLPILHRAIQENDFSVVNDLLNHPKISPTLRDQQLAFKDKVGNTPIKALLVKFARTSVPTIEAIRCLYVFLLNGVDVRAEFSRTTLSILEDPQPSIPFYTSDRSIYTSASGWWDEIRIDHLIPRPISDLEYSKIDQILAEAEDAIVQMKKDPSQFKGDVMYPYILNSKEEITDTNQSTLSL